MNRDSRYIQKKTDYVRVRQWKSLCRKFCWGLLIIVLEFNGGRSLASKTVTIQFARLVFDDFPEKKRHKKLFKI